jgi:spermidine synthase
MILLEDVETEFGNIRIVRHKRDGSYAYYQGFCSHSEANKEGVSTCTYVHTMSGIIQQVNAQRVLMIGCAGGSLATMLHRAGCKVTAVDINPYAFTLAKRYFQMPEEIRCVVQDGRSYVEQTNERFDAIAIDAFSSDGSIPKELTTGDFFEQVSEVLEAGGVVVMNVIAAHDLDLYADRIAVNMESARLPAVLFDRTDRMNHNVVIAGGNVADLNIPYGNEPAEIIKGMNGIIRRDPKRRTVHDY